MALSLELTDAYELSVFSKEIICILFVLLCNSMPCSGCSPLHGVNSKFKKEGQLSLARLSKIID